MLFKNDIHKSIFVEPLMDQWQRHFASQYQLGIDPWCYNWKSNSLANNPNNRKRKGKISCLCNMTQTPNLVVATMTSFQLWYMLLGVLMGWASPSLLWAGLGYVLRSRLVIGLALD